MGGFESGATDADDLFAEDDSTESEETDATAEQESEPPTTTDDVTAELEAATQETSTASTASTRSPDRTSSGPSGPISLQDLDLDGRPTPRLAAEALKGSEYHEENPSADVLYGTWRDGAGHERNRVTYETQHQTEDFIEDVQSVFRDEYGFNIKKTDLREIALVLGLLRLEDIHEVATNWGLQYD